MRVDFGTWNENVILNAILFTILNFAIGIKLLLVLSTKAVSRQDPSSQCQKQLKCRIRITVRYYCFRQKWRSCRVTTVRIYYKSPKSSQRNARMTHRPNFGIDFTPFCKLISLHQGYMVNLTSLPPSKAHREVLHRSRSLQLL